MTGSADIPGLVHTKQSLIGDVVVGVVALLRDGQEMYATAAERTKDPYVHQLCIQMINSRQAACVRLGPFAAPSPSEVPGDATLQGKAETVWTDIKALIGDTDEVFLTTLSDVEAMTITKLDEALDGLPDGDAKRTVSEIRNELRIALDSVEAARPAPNQTTVT